MLLAIDIGNTSIHNGLFEEESLKKTFRIPTYAKSLRLKYLKNLRPYLKDIECVIIVSVAPKALKEVRRALKKIVSPLTALMLVGKDIDSGVKNLYKNPRQVGQDRLVNARAAYELYNKGAIIVDFGTAITIDVVNKNKEYIGGVIAPGVEISLNALSEKASLLPKVRIKRPKGILGKETTKSMINGAIYGFSSLCDGIVQRLKVYCKGSRVIATGGLSPLLGPYCKSVNKIDPELTLKGLRLIFDTHPSCSQGLNLGYKD